MKKTMLAVVAALVLGGASQPAFAAMDDNEGHVLVRGRILGVLPDESADITPVGGDVDIDNSIVPEVDFSYFFTNNIALELIAAVTPHDATAVNTSLGDVDVGDVWLLPPTLTLQYHFTGIEGVKPYVGAGVNFTHFFNADAGALSNVDYKDSFGPALQAGIDVPINDKWFFNADVKKIWIDTEAKFNNGGVRADIDINPWVVGVGVGYRF